MSGKCYIIVSGPPGSYPFLSLDGGCGSPVLQRRCVVEVRHPATGQHLTIARRPNQRSIRRLRPIGPATLSLEEGPVNSFAYEAPWFGTGRSFFEVDHPGDPVSVLVEVLPTGWFVVARREYAVLRMLHRLSPRIGADFRADVVGPRDQWRGGEAASLEEALALGVASAQAGIHQG